MAKLANRKRRTKAGSPPDASTGVADAIASWCAANLASIDPGVHNKIEAEMRVSGFLYYQDIRCAKLDRRTLAVLQSTRKILAPLLHEYVAVAQHRDPIFLLRDVILSNDRPPGPNQPRMLIRSDNAGLLPLVEGLIRMYGAKVGSRRTVARQLKARGVTRENFSLSEDRNPSASELLVDNGAWFAEMGSAVTIAGAYLRLRRLFDEAGVDGDQAHQHCCSALRVLGVEEKRLPSIPPQMDSTIASAIWPGGRPLGRTSTVGKSVDVWETWILDSLAARGSLDEYRPDELLRELNGGFSRISGGSLTPKRRTALGRAIKFTDRNSRTLARHLAAAEIGKSPRWVRDHDI